MEQARTTVTFLGTSTVVPTAGHDTVSFLINGKYLMDTGWYSAIKMLQYGFSPMDLEYLFISHCHHDHYIGLPHILFYLRMRRNERPDRPPLKVVGPAEDIQLVVDLARQFLQTERFPDVECIPDILPLAPGESLDDEAFRVDTCDTVHAVQGLCYKFTDKKTGATLAFTGDTGYHPPIAEHVKGVSLLIHEASHGPNSPEPNPNVGHCGAPDAARIASAAQVKQLALVHCPEKLAGAALLSAQKFFPNTFFPEDGQSVEIKDAKKTFSLEFTKLTDEELEKKLQAFEMKYKLDSETLYKLYQQGKAPEWIEDRILWAGLYRLKKDENDSET